MRRTGAAVLAALLAAAGGCGADPDSGPTLRDDVEALSPPGTPLAAGLVVPIGARLVGPVFQHVAFDDYPPTVYVAVLEVDDPFVAWDDLARQSQDIGLALPGSGICWWRHASPGIGEAPTDAPVSAPRPPEADALSCEAGARGPVAEGSQVMVQMRLWWWAAGAELHLEITEGDMAEPPYAYPETDPGPAPTTAASELPDRDEPTSISAGEPFGGEHNCFEKGYDRFTLPDGAHLIGGGATPGLTQFAAVLAVEDAKAVLEDLRDQLDDPDNPDGSYRLTEDHLADGTAVWTLTGAVQLGGGSCYLWSSPDGDAVMVTTSSD